MPLWVYHNKMNIKKEFVFYLCKQSFRTNLIMSTAPVDTQLARLNNIVYIILLSHKAILNKTRELSINCISVLAGCLVIAQKYLKLLLPHPSTVR